MPSFAMTDNRWFTGGSTCGLRGHAEAQVVAHYLIVCPQATMIGIFQVGEPQIAHETGVAADRLPAALKRLEEVGFLRREPSGDWFWIVDMPDYRLPGGVSEKDHRRTRLVKDLEELFDAPFVREFIERHGTRLGLCVPSTYQGPSMALGRPSEGPMFLLCSDSGSDREGDARGRGQTELVAPTPPRPKRQRPTVTPGVQVAFDRFWAAYPPLRGNPKAIALDEFAKLLAAGAADADTIIAGAAAYAEFIASEPDPPKVAHARTWLHQKRWNDYGDKPAAPGRPLDAEETGRALDRWAASIESERDRRHVEALRPWVRGATVAAKRVTFVADAHAPPAVVEEATNVRGACGFVEGIRLAANGTSQAAAPKSFVGPPVAAQDRRTAPGT